MSRKNGVAETPEYVSFARRAVRALDRRIMGGDVDDLVAIIRLHEEFETMLLEAIEEYVASDMHLAPHQRTRTWTNIGKAFGMSRQAAQQKWSRAGRVRTAAATKRYREKALG